MKMKSKHLLWLVFSLLLWTACEDDEPIITEDELWNLKLEIALKRSAAVTDIDFFKMPLSHQLNQIPQDPNNPLTAEKVALGQLLYHETGIGLNPIKGVGLKTYSCSSCHFAAAGFQAGVKQGIGEGGMGFGLRGEGRVPSPSYVFSELDVQPIRTPSAMNAAFQELMLWNGQFGGVGMNVGTEAQWTTGTPMVDNHLGFHGVETQAIAGLKVHRLAIDSSILAFSECKDLFDRSFGNLPVSDRYTRITAGLAIAAYERTLLANEAPFQKWLRGDKTAMTRRQIEGAVLFFDKAGCGDCHTGPALNSMNFYAYGMNDLEGDGTYGVDPNHSAHLGRGGFTKNSYDDFKFKVPQLYNLKDSPHYGHGGSFNTVRAVVEYKNRGVRENPKVPQSQLALQFNPLGLTETEIDAIVDFIENALYDPNLARYQPDHIVSGLCFPNNDPTSKTDLGCN